MTKSEYTPSICVGIMSTAPRTFVPDPAYVPVLVGAAANRTQEAEKTFTYFDDTGDNISDRNCRFCELTGLYWMWKNLDQDYIGVVHYRRFLGSRMAELRSDKDPFKKAVSGQEIEKILKKHRIILPVKRQYYIETLASHYDHTHDMRHIMYAREIIDELYPEYTDQFDKVMKHTSGYMFNIMIADRKLIDQYCSWLFPILFRLEKRVDETGMNAFQLRYVGRVAEIIFNVWLEYQIETGALKREDIYELPVVFAYKYSKVRKAVKFLRAKLFNEHYES